MIFRITYSCKIILYYNPRNPCLNILYKLIMMTYLCSNCCWRIFLYKIVTVSLSYTVTIFLTFELLIQSFHKLFFHGVYSGKSSLLESNITLRINNKISGNSPDIEAGHQKTPLFICHTEMLTMNVGNNILPSAIG